MTRHYGPHFWHFQTTEGVHNLLVKSSDFAAVQPLSLDEVLKKRKEEEEALAKVCPPPLISLCNGFDCLGFLSLPQPTTDQSKTFDVVYVQKPLLRPACFLAPSSLEAFAEIDTPGWRPFDTFVHLMPNPSCHPVDIESRPLPRSWTETTIIILDACFVACSEHEH